MNAFADGADETAYGSLAAWACTGSDGVTVRGRRRDAAPGMPTVHWLHGNGFCGGVYWSFLRRLDPRLGLITHDIEGHGESDPARDFAGVPATMTRVHGGLAQNAPSAPLIAMGHSFGAALSLRAVIQNPERFAALVLLDPIFLPPRYWLGTKLAAALGRHPFAAGARRRRSTWADADTARERLRGRGIYASWCDEALDDFVRHATRDADDGRALACDPELEAQIFENPLYPWRDLPRLQVPTFLYYGVGSYFFMAPSARRAARLQPHLEAEGTPGGHCFMLEHPDVAAARVGGWLSHNVRGG